MIKMLNMDCMEYMRTVPDKYFDLAIVDPPYGIDAANMQMGKGKNKQWKNGKDWDKSVPDKRYFNEVMRSSKKK